MHVFYVNQALHHYINLPQGEFLSPCSGRGLRCQAAATLQWLRVHNKGPWTNEGLTGTTVSK